MGHHRRPTRGPACRGCLSPAICLQEAGRSSGSGSRKQQPLSCRQKLTPQEVRARGARGAAESSCASSHTRGVSRRGARRCGWQAALCGRRGDGGGEGGASLPSLFISTAPISGAASASHSGGDRFPHPPQRRRGDAVLCGQVFPEHLLCAAQQRAGHGEAGGQRSELLGLRSLADAGGVAWGSALRLLVLCLGLQAVRGLPATRDGEVGVSAPRALPPGREREQPALLSPGSGVRSPGLVLAGVLAPGPVLPPGPAASAPRPVFTWPLLAPSPVSPSSLL